MKFLTLALILFLGSIEFAQNNGCYYPQSNQFDFWVGNWEVYNTKGILVGKNRVEKQYKNCVLQENWVSQGKGRGTSYNYYNPTDNTWNQLWLDNQGSILKLKGRFSENKMVLKSELSPGKKVALYYNQITWTNNNDGTVSQIWEVFDDKHNLLNTAFHGIYKKKK